MMDLLCILLDFFAIMVVRKYDVKGGLIMVKAVVSRTRVWHRKDLCRHMTDYQFRKLIKSGQLERVQKGIYAFREMDEPDNDMVLAQQFYPQAVMGGFTAASFYGLTTIIPRSVQITLPSSGTRRLAKPDYPAIEFFFTSDKTMGVGLDTMTVEDHKIRIYDRERVVCDMFSVSSAHGTGCSH